MAAGARWVAGSLRSFALSQRRLGASGARALARRRSLGEALQSLSSGPYAARVHDELSLAEAHRAVVETALWHVRVLAGWLPPDGAHALRTLAGWWELLNIEDHLARSAGAAPGPPYDLGPLATLPRIDAATDVTSVRTLLRRSPWGDPGSDNRAEIHTHLRLRLAARVAQVGPPVERWAAARAAIWIAEARFVDGQRPARAAVRRLPRLGSGWEQVATLPEFVDHLYPHVARPLAGVVDPAELWKAEARWWTWVEAEADQLLQRRQLDGRTPLAAASVLGADAWRVKAALTLAASGGGDFDRQLDAA